MRSLAGVAWWIRSTREVRHRLRQGLNKGPSVCRLWCARTMLDCTVAPRALASPIAPSVSAPLATLLVGAAALGSNRALVALSHCNGPTSGCWPGPVPSEELPCALGRVHRSLRRVRAWRNLLRTTGGRCRRGQLVACAGLLCPPPARRPAVLRIPPGLHAGARGLPRKPRRLCVGHLCQSVPHRQFHLVATEQVPQSRHPIVLHLSLLTRAAVAACWPPQT